MGGTEILEVVRQQLEFETEFHRHAQAPQLLGRSTQRVWSSIITLCKGVALLCYKKVLRRCTWIEKVVRRSPDQFIRPRGVGWINQQHHSKRYTCVK